MSRKPPRRRRNGCRFVVIPRGSTLLRSGCKDSLVYHTTYSSGYNAQGKRRRRTIFGTSRDEVRNKLTKVLSTRLDRPHFEATRARLCDYLDQWLETAARPTVRPATYESYRGIIRNHINPRIGGVALAKLSATHLQTLYAEMAADRCSPRVRQLTHAVLRRALKQAIRWGLLMWNPCEAVEPPRVPQAERTVLAAGAGQNVP